jgi:hypothetical protein
MGLCPPRDAASCAATQQLPYSLRNPQVHYRVHKSPPLAPTLNQINPNHNTPSYPRRILIFPANYVLVVLVAILSWLSHQYPKCNPLVPIHAACPANLILILIIIWVQPRINTYTFSANSPCSAHPQHIVIFIFCLFDSTFNTSDFRPMAGMAEWLENSKSEKLWKKWSWLNFK